MSKHKKLPTIKDLVHEDLAEQFGEERDREALSAALGAAGDEILKATRRSPGRIITLGPAAEKQMDDIIKKNKSKKGK